MTSILREDVKHLAELSDISLDEDEMENLQKDLEQIVKYINQLSELNTDNVKPTYQVIDLNNVWRDDEINDYDLSREELLNLAPEIKRNQIKVPKVL